MTPTYPGRDAFTEPRARSTDPETSRAAGRAVDAEGQRGTIMVVLRGPGRMPPTPGWTADEIDGYIGWRVTTAGRRLSELHKADPPLVEKCGERRTRSNRMATVYRVVA